MAGCSGVASARASGAQSDLGPQQNSSLHHLRDGRLRAVARPEGAETGPKRGPELAARVTLADLGLAEQHLRDASHALLLDRMGATWLLLGGGRGRSTARKENCFEEGSGAPSEQRVFARGRCARGGPSTRPRTSSAPAASRTRAACARRSSRGSRRPPPPPS